MVTNDKISDALQDVLTRVIDSADGYQKAADAADSSRFAARFREKAMERQGFADEIRQELQSLGNPADDDGSLLAKSHRIFLNLRAMMDDDEAVFEEVIRGESKLADDYEEALEEIDGGSTAQNLLLRQSDKVKRDLQEMRRKERAID